MFSRQHRLMTSAPSRSVKEESKRAAAEHVRINLQLLLRILHSDHTYSVISSKSNNLDEPQMVPNRSQNEVIILISSELNMGGTMSGLSSKGRVSYPHLCSRRRDTRASTQPLITQGKELRGAMSTLNSARDVKTTSAVSEWPMRMNMVKVRMDVSSEVAAQKYTQRASRYLRTASACSSPLRASSICTHREPRVNIYCLTVTAFLECHTWHALQIVIDGFVCQGRISGTGTCVE